MNSVRVAIAGAGGRMGRALLEAATSTQGVTLAAAIDVTASMLVGRDAGDMVPGARGVRVGSDVRAALAAADVLIDFTRPAGSIEHLRACREMKRAMVIGTTGFDGPQLAEVRAASGEIATTSTPDTPTGETAASATSSAPGSVPAAGAGTSAPVIARSALSGSRAEGACRGWGFMSRRNLLWGRFLKRLRINGFCDAKARQHLCDVRRMSATGARCGAAMNPQAPPPPRVCYGA